MKKAYDLISQTEAGRIQVCCLRRMGKRLNWTGRRPLSWVGHTVLTRWCGSYMDMGSGWMEWRTGWNMGGGIAGIIIWRKRLTNWRLCLKI